MLGIASTQLTPEEISAISHLQPGQDADPGYLALTHKFQHMRTLSQNIINFYVMRVEGDRVTFLLDDVADKPAKIGQIYD